MPTEEDGEASLATSACLLEDGHRSWVKSEDTGVFDELLTSEPCGRRARVKGRVLGEL